MDVSNCPDCKRALKRALLKGDDPTKLKMKDGHLVGCPSLSPPKEEADAIRRPEAKSQEGAAYPWSEQNYRIAPPPRLPAEQSFEGWTDRSGGNRGPATHREPAGSHDGSTPAPTRSARDRSDRRAEQGRRPGVPDSGYAQAAAAAERPRVQQFKVVDHANRGEQKDHRKGVWFVAIVVLALLTVPVFPPLALLYIGMAIMLFLL